MMNETEIELQKSVHALLSDPSIVRSTTNGKRLQILSPGRHNVHGGPDYKDTAILLNGNIIVGDAEFHRNSSEWFAHAHNENKEFDSVVLHVVLNDDNKNNLPFDTLLLNKVELRANMEKLKTDVKPDINSIQDLQDYALIRLLRKSSDAKKVLNFSELNDGMRVILSRFIDGFNKRKRRPAYNEIDFKKIIYELTESGFHSFLNDIKNGKELPVIEIIPKLLSEKVSVEGSNLRQEIFLNCILPMALCLADEQTRIELFLWYWSTPALNYYGVLTRRFPTLPQTYIWQQQGMLEYMKEHGNRKIISESIKSYGFADILDFYRTGRETVLENR